MNKSEALAIIEHYYHNYPDLKQLLLKHSDSVRCKALEIIDRPECAGITVDRDEVECGALLHDIGIFKCHAPGILCYGSAPYIAHGIIGAELLLTYGAEHGIDLRSYAGICAHHTGSGLTRADIKRQNIPLPCKDYLPETVEEKLICLADKFFSKSGNMQEKSLKTVCGSMAKYGEDSLRRFKDLCLEFGIQCNEYK